jgi:hypothetical protein
MERFQVWYCKYPFERIFGDQEIDPGRITETHAFVTTIPAEDPEQVFYHMQGEIWSPNGEARDLIMALGLKHTSMSVGDVVKNTGTGEWFKVANVGFEKIA